MHSDYLNMWRKFLEEFENFTKLENSGIIIGGEKN